MVTAKKSLARVAALSVRIRGKERRRGKRKEGKGRKEITERVKEKRFRVEWREREKRREREKTLFLSYSLYFLGHPPTLLL